MSATSDIEWTDATWNPVRGCDKVSPGCKYCYAERHAERFRGTPGHAYEQGFDLRLVPKILELPLRWRKPKTIFANSMSDLFHEDVPAEYVAEVFRVMKRARWHRFQVLTKRADRLMELAPSLPWPVNVWMGVSVESKAYLGRVDALRTVPAAVRFLSLEPLLEDLGIIDLRGIQWVIVGGESGPSARGMDAAWARSLRDQAHSARVPFFFKQWGGRLKKKTGRELDGATWDEMPPWGTGKQLELVGPCQQRSNVVHSEKRGESR